MMKNMNISKKIADLLLSMLGFAVVLTAWELAVRLTDLGTLIPGPIEVIKHFIKVCYTPVGRKYTLLQHLGVSLRRVLTGYGLSIVAGILLGIGMGRFDVIESAARPLFELVRPIPGVAWIPMAIVWFGIGETAKIFIIFMGGFVNIVVNTFAGAKRVDQNLLNVAQMLGANSRQTFFRVVIPSCVPYIFSGLQVGLSTCWMAVLAAEMVAAREGIGWVITAGQENADMPQIFVGVVAIAVVGLALAGFMRFMERIMCRWRVRGA